MSNRLAQETSPYLLQHAHNPVDWWPWSHDAFEEARRRGVPVLLSVGYSSCHWCHVMAHESFEDEETAAVMNERFVNIKVDREERPDVDAVYMEAVVAATGHGGWPMTVFLTEEGEPFYFGTYFPPTPRRGMPGFRQVLEGVTFAWTERREQVAEAAAHVVRELADRGAALGTTGEGRPPGPEVLAQALLGLARDYDSTHGGFAGAPKFPPSMIIEFLLRHHARTGSEEALQMAADTCEHMARGGIYDQLGGGFARYSVDGEWTVPHFEKMLYDNALLCRGYAHLWRATGSDLARRVALETADFMVRELGTAEGGFASALDADSELAATDEEHPYNDADGRRAHGAAVRETAGKPVTGPGEPTTESGEPTTESGEPVTGPGETGRHAESGRHVEGAYYVWTRRQLREVLGEADAELAADYFDVTEFGNFAEGPPGSSVLRLAQAADAVREAEDSSAESGDRRPAMVDAARISSLRERLLAARGKRPAPGRDDKVVAAWNGLAIAALAEVGAYFDRPDLVDAACAGADLLVRVHMDDGARLVRTSRDGRAGPSAGVLEDYGDVAEGFLALAAVTGDGGWLRRAGLLLDQVLERFVGAEGELYDTAVDAEQLIRRPQDPTDNAVPSGWTAAAGALLSYAAHTGSAPHRTAAERALGVVGTLGPRAPRFVGWGLAVAEAALDGPREVAVVGAADDPAARELRRIALLGTAPGAVVAAGPPGSDELPLLANRPLVHDRPAAYVCRNFTCDAPTTDPHALRRTLGVVNAG